MGEGGEMCGIYDNTSDNERWNAIMTTNEYVVKIVESGVSEQHPKHLYPANCIHMACMHSKGCLDPDDQRNWNSVYNAVF